MFLECIALNHFWSTAPRTWFLSSIKPSTKPLAVWRLLQNTRVKNACFKFTIKKKLDVFVDYTIIVFNIFCFTTCHRCQTSKGFPWVHPTLICKSSNCKFDWKNKVFQPIVTKWFSLALLYTVCVNKYWLQITLGYHSNSYVFVCFYFKSSMIVSTLYQTNLKFWIFTK